MRRNFLNAILVVALLSQAGIADDPLSKAAVTTVLPEKGDTDSTRGKSVDQMLTILDELENAGKAIEAAHVRAQARELAIKENLIQRKTAELESLQKELDRLRQLTDESERVKVRLLAIEVDRTRLGDLSEEFDRLIKNPSNVRDLLDTRRESPLFKELSRRNAIDYLGTPTLSTTSGQVATVRVGGKKADGTRDTRQEFVGIQAEVLPTVRARGQIRLQLKFRKNALQTVVPDDDGSPIPIVNVTSTENDVTLPPGQTIVLGGMRRIRESEQAPSSIAKTTNQVVQLVNADKSDEKQRKLDSGPLLKKSEDVELLFFLSAELIDPSPADNPFKSVTGQQAKDATGRRPVRNYLRDDLQYFPAGPDWKQSR
jgi:hypothetical protein